ncbi:peptidoglycan endopeptidase, partial [Lactiplantibacillus pentosus]
AVAKGTLVTVKGIEYTTGGTPRLVVDGGYITANKVNVVKPVSNLSDYYTTNPKYVTALKKTHVYTNLNLSDGMVKEVAKGTVVAVTGIEYSTNGYPRLVVSGGYITANKSNVEKTTSNAAKAASVVALAKTKLGDPYTTSQSGRLGPDSFDCSGFVYYLYKTAAGITLSGNTTTTEEGLGKEVSLSALQPGDLLFYGTRGSTYHVGIYEGDGIMIHAATESEGVKETAIKYYEPSFARRILY